MSNQKCIYKMMWRYPEWMWLPSNNPDILVFLKGQFCGHTLRCCAAHTHKFKTRNVCSSDLPVCGLWFKQHKWIYIEFKCGSKDVRCWIGTCPLSRQNSPSDLALSEPSLTQQAVYGQSPSDDFLEFLWPHSRTFNNILVTLLLLFQYILLQP